MGIDDQVRDKLEEIKGRAKEAAGAATDNDSLKAEGEIDQAKAHAKQAIDNAQDKLKDKLD